MSFARSSSTTSSAQYSYQQQVQAGEGATAIGAGGTLIQTDLGAIKQAAALGQSAIEAASGTAETAIQATKSLAGTAVQGNVDVTTIALEKGEQGLSQFAQNLTDLASIQAQKDSQARLQELELASSLSSQVVKANQPADVTVTTAATDTVKYVVAGLAAIAAAFFLFSGRTKAA